MTTESHNPYEPPVTSRTAPAERIRHPHQLARFYLLAIVSFAMGGISAFVLFLHVTTSYHGLTPAGLLLAVVLSGIALLGIFSAVGLWFAQTWSWYVALLQYVVVLLTLLVPLVRASLSAAQGDRGVGSDITFGVFAVLLALALLAMLLDRVSRRLLKVRWPRWLVP